MTFDVAKFVDEHKRQFERYDKKLGKKVASDYLDVKWRLVWFREENPDGCVLTELVEHDPDAARAIFKATVTRTNGATGTGYKSETRSDFDDYLEKAETGAIGRALAALGYGTQFAPDLDEGGRVVDSPVQPHVPTREREVDDVPIVRSTDDDLWKRWQTIRKMALDLGLKVPEIRLPVARGDLEATGLQVREAIVVRRQQVPAGAN